MLTLIKTLVAQIPFSVIAGIGKFLGMVAYAVDKRHRMVVKHNLSFIFPNHSPAQNRLIARNVFSNTAITFLDILQIVCSSREQVRQRISLYPSQSLIDQLMKMDKFIIVSAHMGNWEAIPLSTALYFNKPLQVVVRPLDSPILNRLIENFRGQFGNTFIDKKGALQKLARTLRDGHSIGMLIDQDIRPKEAVKANFLGKAVNTTPAVAWLAQRYNCPVVPIFCLRESDGELVIKLAPPLALKRTNNPKEDVLTNTQIINDAVSKAVLEHVDQWFWFHKRWKRYYPDIYPEEIKRLDRLEKKKAKKRLKAKKRAAKK